jgi:hypothetical protein
MHGHEGRAMLRRPQKEGIMSTESDNYIAKRGEFIRVQRERDSVIQYLVQVTDSIKTNPEKFSFSNIKGAAGLPAEVALSRVSADANKWPTAEDIQQRLLTWHKAKDQMIDAWHRVPEEEQQALQSPPGLR